MDATLKNFSEINPSVQIQEKNEKVILSKLWNDGSFDIVFDKADDASSLLDISLPDELSAIHHVKKGLLEFVFSPLPKDDPIIRREFSFNYCGFQFKCYFRKISPTLEFLAKGFIELEESVRTSYRNLRPFFLYYNQPKCSEKVRQFFRDRVPVSFFVQGEFGRPGFNLIELLKHLNFYMIYFDRGTPIIDIHDIAREDGEKISRPCYFTASKCFPPIVSARKLNPIILDILFTAKTTPNPRLKYLFYFQVLEYCSYYYLSDDLRKKLRSILIRPEISADPDASSKNIIEEFKEHFKQNDDTVKLQKVVKDFCRYGDIIAELKANSKFFCSKTEFDGGFVLEPVFKDEEGLDKPSNEAMILKTITDNIEDIRNVLVHLREARESKIILPTKKNTKLLMPYLYLIMRIAEKVAIQYE